MTNRIAIVLGAAIVALCALDLMLNDGDALLFLGRRLLELIEWMAFWR
ncbi:hypothetical protein [uncultured Roseobacter sp.]|nr:hypothetical protein [uncultured Roseobacter sp.]